MSQEGEQNLMGKDENCKFGDMWYVHVCLCSTVKCKCWWRGGIVIGTFANSFEYSPKSGHMTYFCMKP